ncbi:endonuclease III [Helicobacter sp. MIT 05-5293]|uniref:endonuclease III n=1 Tax=Helicobacter sp. MIT 05-5293 TaxID=1548149 RepID=UPI000690FDF0|nr:endonuclease III [Helicobacter sp. MIT 05-5293]TLD80566.1 endonuclease III [Helicobacter sp. MIT 05-5293]
MPKVPQKSTNTESVLPKKSQRTAKKWNKQDIEQIKQLFLEHYKDAKTELHYRNLYELLVAVMLSAQCTDKRVNIVTPALFEKYPDVQSLSQANIEDIKMIIKSVSFFNNKASHLHKMANQVMQEFNGVIPTTQAELKTLAGVGQKTANVVLIEFFEQNYMAVDTHVFRVSHRLGLSNAKTALQTESELAKLFGDHLCILHQAFVLFGRYTCKALKPMCESCFIAPFCQNKSNFKPI